MKTVMLLYVVGLTLGYLPSTLAAPSLALVDRHDHHHDHTDHEQDDHSFGTQLMPSLPSTASTAISSSSSSHDPAPHNPHAHSHGHGSHHQPQVELNETDVHYWHHFPPSYLAADFRLSKDRVIFGEELDETWTPETEGGHMTLALGHAASLVLAYFGFLPVGKSHFRIMGVKWDVDVGHPASGRK